MFEVLLFQAVQSGLGEDLGKLIAEGGSLGTVTFTVLAAFFWLWKNYFKRGDIENNKKMLISFVTPIVIANGAYWIGVLVAAWPPLLETWWQAMKVAGLESMGALGLRGALGLAERNTKKSKAKRAAKVQKLASEVPYKVEKETPRHSNRDSRGRFTSDKVPIGSGTAREVTPEMLGYAARILEFEDIGNQEMASYYRVRLREITGSTSHYAEAMKQAQKIRVAGGTNG
jgi:hypothetical protein